MYINFMRFGSSCKIPPFLLTTPFPLVGGKRRFVVCFILNLFNLPSRLAVPVVGVGLFMAFVPGVVVIPGGSSSPSIPEYVLVAMVGDASIPEYSRGLCPSDDSSPLPPVGDALSDKSSKS